MNCHRCEETKTKRKNRLQLADYTIEPTAMLDKLLVAFQQYFILRSLLFIIDWNRGIDSHTFRVKILRQFFNIWIHALIFYGGYTITRSLSNKKFTHGSTRTLALGHMFTTTTFNDPWSKIKIDVPANMCIVWWQFICIIILASSRPIGRWVICRVYHFHSLIWVGYFTPNNCTMTYINQ